MIGMAAADSEKNKKAATKAAFDFAQCEPFRK
jgi:hypothetical protein